MNGILKIIKNHFKSHNVNSIRNALDSNFIIKKDNDSYLVKIYNSSIYDNENCMKELEELVKTDFKWHDLDNKNRLLTGFISSPSLIEGGILFSVIEKHLKEIIKV